MNDWWLKFKRAEKHMVDINQEAVRYAESHPYEFTRLPESKKQIRGRFRITEQPDPMIAVMLGDFVHNLRSALDYVVVACVPKQCRKHASYPIIFQDIFAKDKNGEFVVKDTQSMENFEVAIKGLHPKARAIIISLQPYNLSLFGRKVDPNLITLGIISRLENADKHRQLITIGCGGRDFTLNFTVPSMPQLPPIPYHKILATGSDTIDDNTIIPYNFPTELSSIIQPSQVDMHLTGTVKILVNVTRTEGNQPPLRFLLDSFMDSALYEVSGILKRLEFFVRS
ncbi:hypothetical protein ACFLXD_04265 [Chloroflexota bacterium]